MERFILAAVVVFCANAVGIPGIAGLYIFMPGRLYDSGRYTLP